MLDGIWMCFDLATVSPERAANIFTTYRPKIIELLYSWAYAVNGYVNGHSGVFLPQRLFGSEAPDIYHAMREFEKEYGDIIDDQPQVEPMVREHVRLANDLEAQRQEITEATDRLRADREKRRICGTDDSELLAEIEKYAIKDTGRNLQQMKSPIGNVSSEELRKKIIMNSEKMEVLKRAARIVRFINRAADEVVIVDNF